MMSYLVRRLVLGLLVLVVAMLLLFVLIYAVPGDPATIALGPRASEAQKAFFREQMGLDQPLAVQAASFLWNLLQGDFGTDILSQRPVADLVFSALPRTVTLAVAGVVWAALLGVPLGIWAALRPGTFIDWVIGLISTSVVALPAFLMAIYALILFSVTLGWFPAIGAGDPGDLADQLHHLVLPAFAIGVAWVGYIARLVRVSMLETLAQPHVRTYRAFGVPDLRIALRYVLPIAVVPVISVLGVGIGNLLSGAVLVEVVFSRPGLGSLAYDAVISRNFPVLLGAVVVTTALYVAANFIADTLIAWLDPRLAEKG
ncbi:ABC peptide/opine transporter inner membrane subunit [Salipiger pallidus]|uniref:ABC peptide/opine transporter inner membrane subunit n=1 Tax=Salipiger pallidus TaxID=1775170 RepID=A0A8J3EHC8_9RHOB|nr:ABC transporter permease [Salipiger pallidus]GGG77290.1 ABC peptide/opine transporter inner membrane subunit [Salipiger pallidus]